MKRIPTPWRDTNRLRLLLTACMILLLVGAGTIAIAQATNYTEGWEDNSFDGYTTATGTASSNEIQQGSVNSGLYALEQEVLDAGGSVSATVTTNDTYKFTPGDSVNVSYHTRAEWQVNENRMDFMWLRIVNDSGSTILEVYRHEFDGSFFGGVDRGWIMKSDVMGVDEAEFPEQTSAVESGDIDWREVTVTSDGNGTDVVLNVDGTDVLTATNNAPEGTEYNGTIQFRTRRTDGDGAGTGHTRSYFDDITIEATPVPDRSLDLQVDSFMKHGTTEHYSVVFDNVTSSSDVTSQANVSSSNTSVISVDESTGTVTSTSISSIDREVTLTANYTGPDGNVWEDEENVTVASATMDNWAILPSWTRIEALFSFDPTAGGAADVETNMVWIILAVLVGMAFTTIASSFAGIGVTTLIVIIGWFWGQAGGVSTVGTGVMLAALFGGLFIGLNLAANIDYAMTRGGGVEG